MKKEMKKLMILTVAACAVAVAQAAPSVNVTFEVVSSSPIHDGTASGLLGAGYSVYFISSCEYSKNYISQVDFLKNLQNNGGDVVAAAGSALIRDASTVSTTTSGNGLINAMTVSPLNQDNFSVATGDYEELSYMSVFMAIVADEGVFVSEDSNGNPYMVSSISLSGNGSDTWVDDTGKGEFTSAGWYTINVPEPTSALLLLAGLAGLALKRQRNKA